jgi:queuosine precursor transporter
MHRQTPSEPETQLRPVTRQYKYYDLIMVAFVTLLLCSNLIGTTKIWQINGITAGGTILFFPITYLFGDILTEVYGYKRSRKVVWVGFAAMLFASFVSWVVILLPPAPDWNHQAEIELIFGQTPRLVVGSLIAYFIGELSNSYILAKMKIRTQGKQLWARFILSTIIGEGIDTLVFYPIAFYGFWPNSILFKVMGTSYIFKVLWEVVMIPFTYKIVHFLKKAEGEDYYDYNTDFSLFSIKT